MKRIMVTGVAGMCCALVLAQEVIVSSFQTDGTIVWSAPSGTVCTIEWSSGLGPEDVWRRSWNDLSGLRMTGTQAVASVPMFYRIACNTNPPVLITPYIDEADIKWVRQGYSESTNAPWGFEHDGIDFQPLADRTPFRAVCDGVITELCLRRGPPIEEEEGNYDVFLELTYDSTWAFTYNFEPKSTLLEDGVAQWTNMAVAIFQEVKQGDILGYLHMGDESAHIHFSALKLGYFFHNGVVVCPGPFFTPEAQDSILRLTTNRFPGATDICYP